MKAIKTLVAVVALFAFTTGASYAGCCDDAKKAGKTCEHKCCVKAAKDGKTCEKCNPKKENK